MSHSDSTDRHQVAGEYDVKAQKNTYFEIEERS
jgi:hypothetical protein